LAAGERVGGALSATCYTVQKPRHKGRCQRPIVKDLLSKITGQKRFC
jgi:hypothetical protein